MYNIVLIVVSTRAAAVVLHTYDELIVPMGA